MLICSQNPVSKGWAPELMLLRLAATLSAGFARDLLTLDRWGSIARCLLGGIAQPRMLSLRHAFCITVALVIAVHAWLGFRLPLLHLLSGEVCIRRRPRSQRRALLQQHDHMLMQMCY